MSGIEGKVNKKPLDLTFECQGKDLFILFCYRAYLTVFTSPYDLFRFIQKKVYH